MKSQNCVIELLRYVRNTNLQVEGEKEGKL